ncbi:MFS transporter, partial [Nocardiopsis tropica]|nr:MFS transporter [Nocardiopsis tropica]
MSTTTPNQTDPRRLRGSPLLDPAFVRLWCGTTASGLATWALPFILG